MIKIACLLGSPRKHGNSGRLAARFCETASELGASVDRFHLGSLDFSGCQNLFRCKKSCDTCGLEDDLTAVLESVRSAEVLVLATPVYFTDVAAPLKACIDRFFSFFVPDYVTAEQKSRLGSGRSLVFIQVQGEPESACDDIFLRYQRPFSMLGYETFHLIRACGVREEGDIDQQPAVFQEAEATARKLLAS